MCSSNEATAASLAASVNARRVGHTTSMSFLQIQKLLEEAAQEEPVGPPTTSAGAGAPAGAASAPPSPTPTQQHAGLQPPHTTAQQQLPMRSNSLKRAAWLQMTGVGRNSAHFSQLSSSKSDAASIHSRHPVIEYGGRQQQLLQRRCCKALKILEQLQQPVFSVQDGGPKEPLPKAALRFCKGLAFVMQRKAGMLAGWNWGHGFVIAHLADGSWSAPCFMRLRYGSLGLTLGVQKIKTCHVLKTDEQVAAFARDQSLGLTLDATLQLDMDPWDMQAPMKPIRHADAAMPDKKEKPHTAMWSDGVMWDVSLRAGVTLVDEHLNEQLYGDGVTPEEILGGRCALPQEFMPLYDAIQGLAAEAQVVKHTVSKFEMARKETIRRAQSSGSGSGSGLLPKVRLLRRWSTNNSMGSSAQGISTPSPGAEAQRGWPGHGGSSSNSLPARSSLTMSAGGSTLSREPSFTGGGFKLFGDVEIDFNVDEIHEQQEAEEQMQQLEPAAATLQAAGSGSSGVDTPDTVPSFSFVTTTAA